MWARASRPCVCSTGPQELGNRFCVSAQPACASRSLTPLRPCQARTSVTLAPTRAAKICQTIALGQNYNRCMRRQLGIAALCVAALVAAAPAQKRGAFGGSAIGGGGSASMGTGHGAFSSQPSSGFRGAPSFGARPNFGSSFGSGFHSNFHSNPNPNVRGRFGANVSGGFRRPFVGPGRFAHRRFYSSVSPFYFGYYGYPNLYSDYGYSTVDAYPAYDYYAGNAAQNSNDLAQQQQDIDRLEDEVASLREERESAPSMPSKRPVEIKSTPTLLVFRDRHTQEVQNYAVVGGTLWIFSEQRATKLPLSWLDIDATTKANDERGVDFRLPN
jgi:hypothetical protein